ncbi:unnamed protein product [Sphenostylis stenocarpa]|uniref:DUF4378 domain-containing protein n=1 Tax=Sphenostylis stenocarpa TaxID=92480 RepID=A0AA86VX73_9FABA|nr:unnamed protein product [Sphenostylis stenocarpa]
MENDRVADWQNEVTKMIVDQRFVNTHYQGKDGAGCQPNQFLDALQILYSNKELFVKLLQDPNSLLVKQIQDLQSSQVKEPCQQARQKTMPQNSNATQRVKPLNSFDRSDLRSSCKHQSSNKIVVLKPGTVNVEKFVETSFVSPPHSPNSFSSNAQKTRLSHFPFSCIKRKLKHVMGVRRQEKQWRTADKMPSKLPSGPKHLGDGKKVKQMEISERNSPINALSKDSYLDLKKRDKIIMLKGREAASFGESCTKNTYNTSVGPCEENILKMHIESGKNPSQMLNEEYNRCINSLQRSVPLPDLFSLTRLHRYCDHCSITEGMRDYSYKSGLPKEGEKGSYNFLEPEIKDPPVAIVNMHTDKLQLSGEEDNSLRNSVPGHKLHAHYDIRRDCRYMDSPTQNIDINNITRGSGSLLDLHAEIQTLPFSPDVSSSRSCQRTEDIADMGNKVEHPNTESVVEQFIKDDVTNLPITTIQPDESPVQVMHNKIEENYLEDLLRLSLDPLNDSTSAKDIIHYVREILHAFILKCDELNPKRSCDQLLDPSIFVEQKETTSQLSGGTIFHDCVIETFMQVYQYCGFPLHVPNVQAYVVKKLVVKEITGLVNLHFHPHPSPLTLEQLVEKDLARRGSWLNIQVDAEDIATEVEKDVLEKLVLEIASEMDFYM